MWQLHIFNGLSGLMPENTFTAWARARLLQHFGGWADEGALIKQGTYLRDGFNLRLGKHAYIGPQCLLQCHAPIEMADHAVLSSRCIVLTTNHEFGPPPARLGPVRPAPVRIGDGSVVGAGAVVTRDVPPNTLVAGNPARVIRMLDSDVVEHGTEERVGVQRLHVERRDNFSRS